MLRQPCINKNSLSTVTGHLAGRRPNRRLEAGYAQYMETVAM